jgi:hypothetical protein
MLSCIAAPTNRGVSKRSLRNVCCISLVIHHCQPTILLSADDTLHTWCIKQRFGSGSAPYRCVRLLRLDYFHPIAVAGARAGAKERYCHG